MTRIKITPDFIREMKGVEPVSALTAYDYPTAKIIDEAQIHIILVGDSLGMVILGYPDTTYVSMDDMIHHTKAVARAKPYALLAADMPINSYNTVSDALLNARRLIDAGAEAVKLEGAQTILPQIKAIISKGIPVIGHIGMLPQHIKEEGKYRVKGKTPEERKFLLNEAKLLEEAGVFAIVLELVESGLAEEITKSVKVPTIGIGSGTNCDGQILVSTDLFGTSWGFIPKHVKFHGNLSSQMLDIAKKWKDSLKYK